MTLGEALDQALAPLHHDDRVLEIAVEVERVEFTQQVGAALITEGSSNRYMST